MFITIPTLHQSNIEADANMHVEKGQVIQITEATALDKKHRNEIKTIVFLKNGNAYATPLTADELLEKLQ